MSERARVLDEAAGQLAHIDEVLADGGTFAPDEVPAGFEVWVREQIAGKSKSEGP